LYVDSHCHLDDESFDADRPAVIARARAAGVRGFVLAGVDPSTWSRQRTLAGEEPGIVWSAGLHPMRAATYSDAESRAALDSLASCFVGPHAARAVGEIGLDARFVPRDSVARQLLAFREQLALARRLDVPVLLHVLGRGTHLRVLETMRRDGAPRRGGIVHSYSGSAELVPEYLALGLSIGFSASVCRATADRTRRAAAAVPIERLLIETDSPDLPPPGREPRNEPLALLDVAEALAKIREVDRDSILAATASNASALLGPF
jgi:TatD DNase family protein